ncbi:serine-rich adhesin for platelets-like [Oppia nitens]|uniref:serine-rich adhesin for platelets-like n=1 Tax=Oppia nitens TaxID=1686743 RepID=UPI0023DCC7D7|nr:serine-rich adhesin for platelets-like [Oppia nitens]
MSNNTPTTTTIDGGGGGGGVGVNEQMLNVFKSFLQTYVPKPVADQQQQSRVSSGGGIGGHHHHQDLSKCDNPLETVVLRNRQSTDTCLFSEHTISPNDVEPEVFDWIYYNLDYKKCPYPLAFALASIVSRKLGLAETTRESQEESSSSSSSVTAIKNIDNSKPALSSNDLYSQSLEYLTEYINLWKDKPELAVEIAEEYSKQPFPLSICAIKNTRRKMEDRHVILHDLNKALNLKVSKLYSYYAIFDGHAGVDAASYLSAHLHHNLVNTQAFADGDIVGAFKEAFSLTDLYYLERSARESRKAGSTALCALLEDRRKLYVTWLGDSQALLVKDGRPIDIMVPHKPEHDIERKRIEELGGFVAYVDTWRVNGTLAVSRAIGDPEHKPYVSSEPDVVELDITDGAADFLILACDGLWDQLTPEEATTIVYQYVCQNADQNTEEIAENISTYLSKAAKDDGSSDNITTIVIFFKDVEQLRATPFEPLSPREKLATNGDGGLYTGNGFQFNDSQYEQMIKNNGNNNPFDGINANLGDSGISWSTNNSQDMNTARIDDFDLTGSTTTDSFENNLNNNNNFINNELSNGDQQHLNSDPNSSLNINPFTTNTSNNSNTITHDDSYAHLDFNANTTTTTAIADKVDLDLFETTSANNTNTNNTNNDLLLLSRNDESNNSTATSGPNIIGSSTETSQQQSMAATIVNNLSDIDSSESFSISKLSDILSSTFDTIPEPSSTVGNLNSNQLHALCSTPIVVTTGDSLDLSSITGDPNLTFDSMVHSVQDLNDDILVVQSSNESRVSTNSSSDDQKSNNESNNNNNNISGGGGVDQTDFINQSIKTDYSFVSAQEEQQDLSTSFDKSGYTTAYEQDIEKCLEELDQEEEEEGDITPVQTPVKSPDVSPTELDDFVVLGNDGDDDNVVADNHINTNFNNSNDSNNQDLNDVSSGAESVDSFIYEKISSDMRAITNRITNDAENEYHYQQQQQQQDIESFDAEFVQQQQQQQIGDNNNKQQEFNDELVTAAAAVDADNEIMITKQALMAEHMSPEADEVIRQLSESATTEELTNDWTPTEESTNDRTPTEEIPQEIGANEAISMTTTTESILQEEAVVENLEIDSAFVNKLEDINTIAVDVEVEEDNIIPIQTPIKSPIVSPQEFDKVIDDFDDNDNNNQTENIHNVSFGTESVEPFDAEFVQQQQQQQQIGDNNNKQEFNDELVTAADVDADNEMMITKQALMAEHMSPEEADEVIRQLSESTTEESTNDWTPTEEIPQEIGANEAISVTITTESILQEEAVVENLEIDSAFVNKLEDINTIAVDVEVEDDNITPIQTPIKSPIVSPQEFDKVIDDQTEDIHNVSFGTESVESFIINNNEKSTDNNQSEDIGTVINDIENDYHFHQQQQDISGGGCGGVLDAKFDEQEIGDNNLVVTKQEFNVDDEDELASAYNEMRLVKEALKAEEAIKQLSAATASTVEETIKTSAVTDFIQEFGGNSEEAAISTINEDNNMFLQQQQQQEEESVVEKQPEIDTVVEVVVDNISLPSLQMPDMYTITTTTTTEVSPQESTPNVEPQEAPVVVVVDDVVVAEKPEIEAIIKAEDIIVPHIAPVVEKVANKTSAASAAPVASKTVPSSKAPVAGSKPSAKTTATSRTATTSSRTATTTATSKTSTSRLMTNGTKPSATSTTTTTSRSTLTTNAQKSSKPLTTATAKADPKPAAKPLSSSTTRSAVTSKVTPVNGTRTAASKPTSATATTRPATTSTSRVGLKTTPSTTASAKPTSAKPTTTSTVQSRVGLKSAAAAPKPASARPTTTTTSTNQSTVGLKSSAAATKARPAVGTVTRKPLSTTTTATAKSTTTDKPATKATASAATRTGSTAAAARLTSASRLNTTTTGRTATSTTSRTTGSATARTTSSTLSSTNRSATTTTHSKVGVKPSPKSTATTTTTANNKPTAVPKTNGHSTPTAVTPTTNTTTTTTKPVTPKHTNRLKVENSLQQEMEDALNLQSNEAKVMSMSMTMTTTGTIGTTPAADSETINNFLNSSQTFDSLIAPVVVNNNNNNINTDSSDANN